MFLVLFSVLSIALVAPLSILDLKVLLVNALLAVIGAFGASYVMTRFVNKKPFAAIGFPLHQGVPREFGMGCAVGVVMMGGIFVIQLSFGYLDVQVVDASIRNIAQSTGYLLVIFMAGAVSEEVIFRGYLLQTLMQGITFLPATLLMALLFAGGHAANPGVTTFALINIGLAAVWLSFAYLKTRALWLPIGLHFGWNFAQTAVFGFPTSGLEFGEYRVLVTTAHGPEWITGGAFGPEGGVLATLALIAGTWYIVKQQRMRAPEGVITLDSVEDLLPSTAGEGQAQA